MQSLLLITRTSAVLLLAALSLPLWAATPAASTTQVFQASDGSGGARLLWWISPERWRPGGFRLEDDRGQVLIEHLGPGTDPATSTQLTQAERDELSRIAQQGVQQDGAITLGLHALGSWDFARALGLAAELSGLEQRPTGFVVRGLGRDGKPDGSFVQTKPIDLSGPTPLHSSPAALRGESDPQGVSLYWRRPAHHLLPILAYRIERSSDEGTISLTPQPLILGNDWSADRPAFVDTTPPLESEVTYLVTAIDVLGRASLPAKLDLLVADRTALQPPIGIEALASDAQVEVSWQANPSPYTTGYIVERSPMQGGPYEVLTPKGIPAKQTRFSDTPPARAAALYYRVRAIDPRGEVGEPSQVALFRHHAAPPPAPTHLKAEPGQTRVRLSWDPAPGAEGYLVERRAEDGEWQALGNLLTLEPRLDDQLGPANGLRLEYRVSAVAWGDATGPACKPVSVEIPDTLPPQPPAIIATDNESGAVLLRFRPAAPEEQTRQLLVLRGGAEDPGLVIGDPLPGNTREWRDNWVLPGETYWYRLVALDAAGNHSVPGEPARVTVSNTTLPKPARPAGSLKSEPFRHVQLSFSPPPEDVQVIVQRALDTSHWQIIAGPQDSDKAIDTNPPTSGSVYYRLVYQAANGAFGPASDTLEVKP